MAGIYIHIPFCKQACLYCGFHFSTGAKHREEMMDALGRELVLQKEFFGERPFGGSPVDTVYLGGGTPSVVSVTQVARLLDQLRDVFSVAPGAEYTLEVNPDDLSPENLRGWQAAGINRLSVGIQSFFSEDLHWMNRAHDADQATGAPGMVAEAGFGNYSCDLIYGYPMLTDEKWVTNIERMISAGVPHLSCYAMTVEARTPLAHQIATHKAPPLDEAKAATQFRMLVDRLTAAGYEQYEISNFAKPGCRARHNSHYWDGTPYLGIGPSAHSFRGTVRQWNISQNARYMADISAGILPFESEQLTRVMQLNEYLMTSLRTMEGCDLTRIADRWGARERARLERESEKFIRAGHMVPTPDRLVLSREGRLFADGIAADLFGEEPD